MKVVTLDAHSFFEHCHVLAQNVKSINNVVAVVGIYAGGAEVAKILFDILKEGQPDLRYFEVRASRSGTSLKNMGIARWLLALLPLRLLDVLRAVENSVAYKFAHKFGSPSRNVELGKEIREYLEMQSGGCVLVVDDAVDTGATMSSVLSALRKSNSSCNYVTAVIVTTTPDPAVKPDISLLQEVLVRFPWSSDAA